MAYTAVKLADVQKAINAIDDAEKAYADEKAKLVPSKTALENAIKNRDTALAKFNDIKNNLEKTVKEDSRYVTASKALQEKKDALTKAQQYYDSKQYLKDNSAYQNALTAYNNAVTEANKITQYRDSGDYLRDDKTYQGALNLLKTREEELRKANDFRNSSDRINNDSDVKYNRQKVEDSKRAIQIAQDDLNKSSERDRGYYEGKLNEAKSQLSKWENELQATINRSEEKATSEVNKFIKLRDEADKAMVDAKTAADNSINSKITAAQSTRNTADANLVKAETSATAAAKSSYDAAKTAFDAADSNFGKVNDLVRKEYDTKLVVPAQNAYNKAIEDVSAAETSYNKINDSLEGLQKAVPERIQDVNNYLNTFKSSIEDIKTTSDATAAQAVLDGIKKSIQDSGNEQLKKIAGVTIADINLAQDKLEVNTYRIEGAMPNLFPNTDPETGLPILDQKKLDAALKSSNYANKNQIRNFGGFGWSMASDNAVVIRGPAVVGIDEGSVNTGTGLQFARGYVKPGTNQAATDEDFKKATEQLGINYEDYVKPVKFVPSSGGYGITEKATAQNSKEYTDPVTGETYLARLSNGEYLTKLDRDNLYKDISDKTKDFYLVSNALENIGNNKPTKHASILFKADGSGNLTPVVNQQGAPVVNYYTATRNVTGETWYGDLLPVAAIGLSLALPGIGSAISSSTLGASLATTLGSQVAANAVINATLSAALSAATGGDPIKAAITAGLGTAVTANIGDIAKAVGIDDDVIGSITSAINNYGGNVTDKDIKNIIGNGLTTALVTGATDSDKILENVLTSVAGNFADANVKNYVADSLADSIDRQKLASAADAAGNVANVATNALISGVDIETALTKAAPSILASASTAYDNALKGKVALNESELSPEAKKIYDNYIASGIDQSSALVAASAADPKFKALEYGKQFGPALAELDLSKLPQVFQNIPKDTNLRYVGKDADGRDQYVITDKEGGQGLYTIQPDGTATISTTVPSEIAARAKDTLTLDEASTANVLPPTLKKETGFFDDLGGVISTGTSSSFGQSRSLVGKLADEFEVKLEPTGSTIINKATGKEITPEQYDDLLKAGKIVGGFKFIADDVFVEFGDKSKNIDEKIVWYDLQPPDIKQKINQRIAENVDNYTKQVEQEWQQTPPEQKFNVTPLDVQRTIKDYETSTSEGGGGAQQPSPEPPGEVAPVAKPAFKPFESQTFEAIQEALRTSQPQAETALSKAVSSVSIANDAMPNADIVLKQYAKDPAVSDYYTSAAKKNFDLMGVQPTEDQISQNAANLYMSDLKEIFAPSSQAPTQQEPTQAPPQPTAPPSSTTQPSQEPGGGQQGVSGETPGSTPGPSTSPTQGTGGTGTGTGTGAGTGSGTGTGSGAGSGAGTGTGTGTGGGVTTVTQPSGIASLFGALAPSAQPQTQGGQLPLASVFYYGKEFGSPRQEVGQGGQLLQEMYRPLSVSQPGPELAASGEKGENAISALLQSILAEKGDEEDILNILRG